jgi:hypothetical protein
MKTKMILKPLTLSQFEISLESEDKSLSFPGAFTSTEGFTFENGGLKTIELKSVYDPKIFKDLVSYCFNLSSDRGLAKKFTITLRYPHKISTSGPGTFTDSYSATGCKLTGFNFFKADRNSGEVSEFYLTFAPGKLIMDPICDPETPRIPKPPITN